MTFPLHAAARALAVFGLGHWEILIIIGVMVLLFGASRIPEMMRSLGKGVTEFKKGMQDDGKESADKQLPDASAPKDGDSAKT